MKIPLVCLILLYILRESYGYKYCSYTSYSTTYRRTVTLYYKCSNNQYCCGAHSCCTYVYSRWYLWFVIVTIFVIIFILWWYYRYRYRPRHIVVGQNAAVIRPGGPVITAYPQAEPVTVLPGGNVHYAAYPPPVYGPVQTHYPPPPAYTSVVKTGATVTTTSFQ